MSIMVKQFQLQSLNTNIATEVRAGITTFLTMAYIVVVNPAILSQAGMDPNSVFLATCLTSALGCFLVGIFANYPIGVAPGMAMNAFFAYQITNNLGMPWQDAMGLICVSGLLFLLICITPVKTWILDAIPNSLSLAISSGIGVFIGFIALKEMGIVVISSSGFMQMGQLNSIPTLIALFGFLSIIIMESYRFPGAIIVAIIFATILDLIFTDHSVPVSFVSHAIANDNPGLFSTFFALSFDQIAFNHQAISIILTFLFVVLFDSTGTLIAVMRNKSKTDGPSCNKQTSNALLANSITTITGSVLGTTPTSPYIESAAGIKAGGKTGLTAITIGVCFLLAIVIAPLAKLVPIYATAPALLYVACLMVEHLADIKWHKLTDAIPAAITLMMIPFTFSIADGIGFGIISYTILNLFCHKEESNDVKVHPMLWVLSVVFIGYFVTKGF